MQRESPPDPYRGGPRAGARRLGRGAFASLLLGLSCLALAGAGAGTSIAAGANGAAGAAGTPATAPARWPATARAETLAGEPVFFQREDGVVCREPALRIWVAPDYPESLRRAGIEGRVTVAITVDTLGSASDVEVHASDHPALEALALAAARQTRWLPGAVAGVPTVTVMGLPYRFELRRGPAD